MKFLSFVCASLLVSFSAVTTANAGPITCAGANRSFTVTDALQCRSGVGDNPDGALINSQGGAFAGTWTNEGELTAPGSNDLLTITLTSGSFGAGDAAGTWTINPIFWTMWGSAVLSAHVGQGGGDPDWWLFLLEPGDLTGTWSYDIFSGTGGGLSNLKLWGSGTPDQQLLSTPEPATLLMLGTGLATLSMTLRRRRRA